MKQVQRLHTFRSIGMAINRDKRTIQNWYAKALADENCTEIGAIDERSGARMFSDDERDILLRYYTEMPTSSRRDTKSNRPAVEICDGTEIVTLDTPEMGGAIDLSLFAGGGKMQCIDDPDRVVEGVTNFLDQVLTHLDSDLEEKRSKLDKTAQAREQVSDKVREFAFRSELYRRDAQAIAREQNTATSDLSTMLEQLAQLGKPENAA